MFIVTTVVAVALWADPLPIAGGAGVDAPVSCRSWFRRCSRSPLIYGRGYARTFAIGALFPAGVAFLSAFGN